MAYESAKSVETYNSDTFLMLGGFVAAFLAGLFGYFRRPKEMTRIDPVIAGVGLEYGNREQTERLILESRRTADQLTRCADQLTILSGAFVDEKTNSINDRLDEQNELIGKLATTVDHLLQNRRTHRNKL